MTDDNVRDVITALEGDLQVGQRVRIVGDAFKGHTGVVTDVHVAIAIAYGVVIDGIERHGACIFYRYSLELL